MKNRGVFGTLSNIYDEAFLQKQVMVKGRYLIFKKNHHRCLYLDMFLWPNQIHMLQEKKHAKFSENRKFLYQVERNFRFSENLACLVSCKTSFEIPPFALLPARFHSTSIQILFPEQGRKDWPFFSYLISLSFFLSSISFHSNLEMRATFLYLKQNNYWFLRKKRLCILHSFLYKNQ